MSSSSPLNLTTSPQLSSALQGDGPAFERAMLDAGKRDTLSWLKLRTASEIDDATLVDLVEPWFAATTPNERVVARVELAEFLDGVDDATSELLWEASMVQGFAVDDGEQAFDAVVHLANMAERTGDPLTAAEFYIDFLNWRREHDHVSDPEAVHHAFEEIVRLSPLGGDSAAAARYAHAHTVFIRVAEDDPSRAMEGDWIESDDAFQGWT